MPLLMRPQRGNGCSFLMGLAIFLLIILIFISLTFRQGALQAHQIKTYSRGSVFESKFQGRVPFVPGSR